MNRTHLTFWLLALVGFFSAVARAQEPFTFTVPVNTDLAITYGEAGNPANSYGYNLYAAPQSPAFIHFGDGAPILENSSSTPEIYDFGTGSNSQLAFYFRSSAAGTFTFQLQYYDHINYAPISPRVTLTVNVTSPIAAPTLTSNAATTVTSTSAGLSGNVTADGGASVTARGFVYSATAANNNPTIGGTSVVQIAAGTGTGAFSTTISSLSGSTGYSFKAYATNSAGTAYSSVRTFTTLAADSTPPTVLSVARQTPAGQTIGPSTSSVTFRVTYSEAVQNVDASHFAVEALNGGSVLGSVPNVSGTGATRDVTVSITGGSGEFRLNVISPALEP